MLTRKIFVVVILLMPLFAKAQLVDLPNIEIISAHDGLPFNTTSAIVQDKQGFIWIGSADGLARYDGYTFISIPRENEGRKKTSLHFVTALSVDTNGNLWIGQLGGFINRMNPVTEEITRFKLENAEDKVVQTIFCDSKGVVWCFVAHAGLYRFDGSEFNLVAQLTNLPNNTQVLSSSYNVATSFVETKNYTFYVSSSNGLYHFDPATSTFEHLSTLNHSSDNLTPTHQLLLDGENGIWCSSYGYGMVYYNLKTKVFESYQYQQGPPGTNNIIYGIAKKNNDEIWISTSGNGLGLFNTKTKKFNFYNEGALNGNGPVCTFMLVDNRNIIWALSDKGLMKWNVNENHFRFNKLKVTRSDNHDYYGVNDVFEDKATGRKIIGTSYADGVHVFDSTGKETILSFDVHPAGEPYLLVTDFMRTHDGKILMISRDYLYELTKDNKLQKIIGPNTVTDQSKPAYYVRMAQSENGDIWIASMRQGLLHFDAVTKKWNRLHTGNTSVFPDNRIARIAIDKQNRVWAAHHRSGISRFNPADNSWVQYKHVHGDSTSLISNLLSDMIVTLTGDVWVATLEGLSKYDASNDSFISYSIDTGLPSQTLYDIASDDENNIWAIGNKGLMVIPAKGGDVLQFDHEQGIDAVYGAFLVRRGTEGKMYGCTYRGYYTFRPAEILKNRRAPSSVVITDITSSNSNDSLVSKNPVVSLSYADNFLTIEFAALNFMGNQNVYRYKMMGLNQQWVETTNHSVTYSSLPPGDYIFEVALKDELASAAALKITVATPIWKQLWFRLSMVVIGLSGIFIVYKIRTQQIRKEEKLKAVFKQQLTEAEIKALKAQMSPHFIFNSLNSINRYIIKAEPEKASLYLTKFSKLIRLILDNSNLKVISLEQELTALKLYIELEALRFQEKFTHTITVNPDLNPMSVGVPPMIIQPFVENAIWHGLLHKETAGHLDIVIERFGSGLKCIITDNGIGRKKAEALKSKGVNKEKSYGMKITHDRLTMLQGDGKSSAVEVIDLKDESGNATGTQVIIKIRGAEIEPEF